MNPQPEVHECSLKAGITRTREFEKKKLATHAVNVGLLCGHACEYCSTPAMIRTHPAFRVIGKSAFSRNLVLIDPDTPDRIARDISKIKDSDTVQLCTTTDAWSPEAQMFQLGRRCLIALLNESRHTVRILTKNAAVEQDYDLIERYRDRVLIGLSLTAPPSRANLTAIYEPRASSLTDRIRALREAARKGLRTFGMVCPCLPGILDDRSSLEEIVDILRSCGVEEVFVEPLNARGKGVANTENAFRQAGEYDLADAMLRIRAQRNWSRYARALIETTAHVFARIGWQDRLRILLYPKGLTPEDSKALRRVPSIIWL